MLTFDKAMLLVEYLLPHMPDDATNLTVLSFGGKILESMANAGQHRSYLQVVSLTSGKSVDELIDLGIEKVFELFIVGLADNELLSLMSFYDGLVKHGR